MNIALLGFGTVCKGVYDIASKMPEFTVKRILVKDTAEKSQGCMTLRYEDILEDSEIECVVEAIGGLSPAKEFIEKALLAGKHVVTANKAVVAAYMSEFAAASKKGGSMLLVEATTGGGIPWLKNLHRAARIDKIEELHGILNGTSNFILSAMFEKGADFADVLKEAQELGYAEADPSADIDGDDVRNKCAISAAVAFGGCTSIDNIPMSGIRHITKADVDWCKKNGYVVKLFATAVQKDGSWCGSVEPVLLQNGMLEAAVPKNYNIASLTGRSIGELKFYGQGAGSLPTGNAIVQDMLDIKCGTAYPLSYSDKLSFDETLLKGCYLLRISEESEAVKQHVMPLAQKVEQDGGGRILVFTKEVSAVELNRAVKKVGDNIFVARFYK